jgi:hypothetical protein
MYGRFASDPIFGLEVPRGERQLITINMQVKEFAAAAVLPFFALRFRWSLWRR